MGPGPLDFVLMLIVLSPELFILLFGLVVPGACVLAVLLSRRPPASAAPVPGSGVRRLGAAWIDGLVVGLPASLLAFVFLSVYIAGLDQPRSFEEASRQAASVQAIQLALSLLSFVAGWLYAAGMESSGRQATLGKMAMGLKVTGPDGRPVSFQRATGRHLAKYLGLVVVVAVFFVIVASVPADRLAGPVGPGLALLVCGLLLVWLGSFAMIPFDRSKRGGHDLMAGTAVVLANSGTRPEENTPPTPAAEAPGLSPHGVALPRGQVRT